MTHSHLSPRARGLLDRIDAWSGHSRTRKVLVRAGAPAADLAHVRLLAAQRGVPVEEVPELAYSCVGLIHPMSRR